MSSNSQTYPLVTELEHIVPADGVFTEDEGIELENIQVKNKSNEPRAHLGTCVEYYRHVNDGMLKILSVKTWLLFFCELAAVLFVCYVGMLLHVTNADIEEIGLTSDEAYKRLCDIIRHELMVFNHANHVGWWQNVYEMLACRGCFSWTSLLTLLLEILLVLLGYFFQENRSNLLLVEVAIIVIMTAVNIILCIKEQQLKKAELSRKAGKLLSRCQCFRKKCTWDHSSYPDLNVPTTDSLSLVWTYRMGKLVNVPCNLLVEGDVIVLGSGQKCPAKVQQVSPAGDRMFDFGQIFHPDVSDKGSSSDEKVLLCQPSPRQRFTVLEAPLKENLRNTFQSSRKRPSSLLENEYYYVTKQLLELRLIPIILGVSFLVNVLRLLLSKKDFGSWSEMIFILQAHVIIPLLPLLFPLMWIIIKCIGTARIQVFFNSASDQNCSIPLSEVHYQFWELLKGESETLTRTANLLHTLGSISVWCCVDKDGVLAFPNPYAEKVFFFRKKKERRHKRIAHKSFQMSPDYSGSDFYSASVVDEEEEDVHGASDVHYQRSEETETMQDKNEVLSAHFNNKEDTIVSHSEVLNLSRDPESECGIIFDDFRWQRHLSSLKPLGLNVLLNSPCSSLASTVKLADHLSQASLLINDAPIRTVRRCLCVLGKQIGFIDAALDGFEKRQAIFAFRACQQLNDSAVQSHSFLSICKENPVPYLTSLVVEHVASGSLQLLSQGSADLLLDVCTDFWDGSEVHPLTSMERKKIHDFFHRTSITSNCIALSYRPITQPWHGSFKDVFLEISEETEWSYSDSDNGSMSSSKSSDSSEDEEVKDKIPPHPVDSNDGVIDLEFYRRIIGGQIFIGMITLQYQAKQDIPPLVEDLNNAGIRFVHFSDENEIKSQVFAERLGLETGWNCHISFSDKTSGFDEHSTITAGSEGKIEETADEYLVSRVMPSHLEGNNATKRESMMSEGNHDDNDDQKGKQEVPSGHGGDAGDIEREEDDEVEKRVKWRDPEENSESRHRKLSDSSSSSSASNDDADEETQGADIWFQITNRAKLPRGIANIRPHLKHVDNVPLLVPLFTDCTPDAIREMISIMQEYGEVVCCIGSSLNVDNVEIFNQADISMALQPTFPQVCLKDHTRLGSTRSSSVAPVALYETDELLACQHKRSMTKGEDLTPLSLSSALNGLSCSLSFRRDYDIKFVALLREARRLCFGLRICFTFMVSCQLTLCLVMLAASLFLLPPPLTGLHLLWFTCVLVPALSLSLVNADNDSALMTYMTAKNDKKFRGYVSSFIRFSGIAFIPSVLICDLVVLPLTLMSFCERSASYPGDKCRYLLGNRNNSETWNGFGETHLSGLVLAQDVVAFFLMLCFVFMSTSYVHRLHPLWKRSPLLNKQWTATIFIVISLQVIYLTLSQVSWKAVTENQNDYLIRHLPKSVFVLVFLWPLAQLTLCELLKRKYIKFFIRYQRRAKLKFGTKLGMNSPF